MTPAPFKIVHVITALDTGGAEVMLSKIVKAMDSSQFETTVIALKSGGDLVNQIRSLGIEVIEIGISTVRSPLAGLIEIWRHFRRLRPDVVQTWLYHADLMGYLAGRFAGVNAVAWNIRCSDMGPDYYRGLTGLIVRCNSILSKRLNAIVTNSEAGRLSHESRGYVSSKWQLIPNGFDLDRFRPDANSRIELRKELGLADSSLLVGLVARLDPVKGHRTFLAAATKLVERFGDVDFVVIGEGCVEGQPEFDRMVPAKLRPRLHALGKQSDIARYYQAFDVAVCSSDTEGFSNTIGEAMACGVPCVVTDVGDNAMIVGEGGVVVPSRNPDAMATAIQNMIEEGQEHRLQFGQRARARISENYSLDVVARQYGELYRSLAG